MQYEIIGHSGEGYKFDMTKKDTPPKDNKQRLDVLKVIYAHTVVSDILLETFDSYYQEHWSNSGRKKSKTYSYLYDVIARLNKNCKVIL